MINLLCRIFIKNREDVKNPEVRGKYGVLCGIVGICFNVLLFLLKLLAGIFSKSVAVVADALNNLSDAAASVITILGFRLSSKKPDADHPFGHGRWEYLSGLIVSFFILLMGFELIKSSVDAIVHPKELDTSFITIVILLISIVVKFYMYFYNHSVAKKINSAAMEATAKDSLNDTISTFVVLFSIILIKFLPNTKIPFDGIVGCVVALFIIYSGVESLKETINPLLGTSADSEFVKQIEQAVLEYEPITGIHDLIVHDYGPGRVMISLHAEVPGDRNIFELHDVIDNAEVCISEKFNCMITIHMDPVDTKNEELPILKKYISEVAKEIDEEITIHDLRMVPGVTHTNIIFDVVKPHKCKHSDEYLISYVSEKVSLYNNEFICVIHIDNPFI